MRGSNEIFKQWVSMWSVIDSYVWTSKPKLDSQFISFYISIDNEWKPSSANEKRPEILII